MDDDEEVIFDQQNLLAGPERPLRISKTPVSCRRLVKTVFLCAAFFGLGLCIAVPGPTLLDLQIITKTTTEEITRIFTGRSIGYLVGSIFSGLLFDRFNQDCLLSCALLFTAVGTALAPWSHYYLAMMGLFAMQGFSMGFLDTGANVMCLHIWGRDSGPYMQAMHFSFGLGAFVSPLVAEPFLGHAELAEPFLGHAELAEPFLGHAEHNSTENLTSSSVSTRLKRNALGLQVEGLVSLLGGSGSHAAHSLHKRGAGQESNQTVGEEHTAGSHSKPKHSGDSLSKDQAVAGGDVLKIFQGTKIPKSNPKLGSESEGCTPTDTSTCPPPLDTSSSITAIPTTTTTTTTTTPSTTTTTTTKTSTAIHQVTSDEIPQADNCNKTNPDMCTTLPTGLETNATGLETNATGLETNATGLETNATDTNPATNIINDVTNKIADTLKKLTKVQFAYLTIALFVLLVSLIFMCSCCCDMWRSGPLAHCHVPPDYQIHKESRGFRVQLLLLLFAFYFLYVGMEVTYGALIMSFAVKYMDWSKEKGTLLTSLFWGSFATARGLAIFLSRCLSPSLMLIADLVVTCLSVGGLLLSLPHNPTMLWFCTATLGAGMASILPTGITWAERYMQVSSKSTAVFIVGSALGEMALPAVTGLLFDLKGPMWLLYVMLAGALSSAVIYVIMQNLASGKGERYQRLNSLLTLASALDDNVELESVQSSPSTSGYTQNGQVRKTVTFDVPEDSEESHSPRRNSGKPKYVLLRRNAKRD